jgi:hypothetical protein
VGEVACFLFSDQSCVIVGRRVLVRPGLNCKRKRTEIFICRGPTGGECFWLPLLRNNAKFDQRAGMGWICLLATLPFRLNPRKPVAASVRPSLVRGNLPRMSWSVCLCCVALRPKEGKKKRSFVSPPNRLSPSRLPSSLPLSVCVLLRRAARGRRRRLRRVMSTRQ